MDDLMNFSKLSSGKIKSEPSEVNLMVLIKKVLESDPLDCLQQGYSSQFRFNDNAAAAVVHWDRTQLERVFSNLIHNAVKYGDGKPIDISIEDCGHGYFVRIRDHGIGIAPENHQRVFSRFERVAEVEEKFPGLGLGLWISRVIMETLGGKIHLQSELGNGATFIVEIPLVQSGVEPIQKVG